MLTITYFLKNGRQIKERHPDSTEDQTEKAKEVQAVLDSGEWFSAREGTSGPTVMIRSEEIERVEVYSCV